MIDEIEQRRRQLRVSIESLCMAAGVGPRTYYDAKAGTYEPEPGTLQKLSGALKKFRLAIAGDPERIAERMLYKASVVIAAFVSDAESCDDARLEAREAARATHRKARYVLAADPARRANGDREWHRAARVRRLGFWIASQIFGMRSAELARAAGVTKAAVSLALRELEDGRDADPELDRIMTSIEELFA
jgi:transcriptional regulator with XRE-family HTH domain